MMSLLKKLVTYALPLVIGLGCANLGSLSASSVLSPINGQDPLEIISPDSDETSLTIQTPKAVQMAIQRPALSLAQAHPNVAVPTPVPPVATATATRVITLTSTPTAAPSSPAAKLPPATQTAGPTPTYVPPAGQPPLPSPEAALPTSLSLAAISTPMTPPPRWPMP